jgi:GT2 family glycosyltransferase/glycosyltransferase involved in cell wall biosynthesis
MPWTQISLLVLAERPSIWTERVPGKWAEEGYSVGVLRDYDLPNYSHENNKLLSFSSSIKQDHIVSLKSFLSKTPFVLLLNPGITPNFDPDLETFCSTLRAQATLFGLTLLQPTWPLSSLAPIKEEQASILDTQWIVSHYVNAHPHSLPPFLTDACIYLSATLLSLLPDRNLSGVGAIEATGTRYLNRQPSVSYLRPLWPMAQRVAVNSGHSFIPPPQTGILSEPPLVSVVIPTFNRPKLLKRAVHSVLNQTLNAVEVIVVNDAGVPPPTPIIDKDPRVRLITHQTNKGLAGARNTGIQNARGTYIAYLDDDDIFWPRHLEYLVKHIEQSGLKVGYSFGARRWEQNEILLKRDVLYEAPFCQDELLFRNYIPVTCIIHHKCLTSSPSNRFNERLKRLEDWDLWRRISRTHQFACLEEATVEYSIDPERLSMTNDDLAAFGWAELHVWEEFYAEAISKPNGPKRVKNALEEALHRIIHGYTCESNRNPINPSKILCGGDIFKLTKDLHHWSSLYPELSPHLNIFSQKLNEEAKISGEFSDALHRCQKELAPFRVSIVVPLFNALEYTKMMLSSLKETTNQDNYELILVDNASTDGTREYLKTLKDDTRVILNDTNENFAGACNRGALAATTPFVLFLNNDTILTPGWLDGIIAELADPSVAMVGNRQLFPDTKLLHHCGLFTLPNGVPKHHLLNSDPDDFRSLYPRETPLVTGACLLVRRELFLILGGFDTSYINGYEDIDLCLRVQRAGLRTVYTPYSTIYHHVSKSPGRTKSEDTNFHIYISRWHKHGSYSLENFHDSDNQERQSRKLLSHRTLPRIGIILPDDWGELFTDGIENFRRILARHGAQNRIFDACIPIITRSNYPVFCPIDRDITRLVTNTTSENQKEIDEWCDKWDVSLVIAWDDHALPSKKVPIITPSFALSETLTYEIHASELTSLSTTINSNLTLIIAESAQHLLEYFPDDPDYAKHSDNRPALVLSFRLNPDLASLQTINIKCSEIWGSPPIIVGSFTHYRALSHLILHANQIICSFPEQSAYRVGLKNLAKTLNRPISFKPSSISYKQFNNLEVEPLVTTLAQQVEAHLNDNLSPQLHNQEGIDLNNKDLVADSPFGVTFAILLPHNLSQNQALDDLLKSIRESCSTNYEILVLGGSSTLDSKKECIDYYEQGSQAARMPHIIFISGGITAIEPNFIGELAKYSDQQSIPHVWVPSIKNPDKSRFLDWFAIVDNNIKVLLDYSDTYPSFSLAPQIFGIHSNLAKNINWSSLSPSISKETLEGLIKLAKEKSWHVAPLPNCVALQSDDSYSQNGRSVIKDNKESGSSCLTIYNLEVTGGSYSSEHNVVSLTTPITVTVPANIRDVNQLLNFIIRRPISDTSTEKRVVRVTLENNISHELKLDQPGISLKLSLQISPSYKSEQLHVNEMVSLVPTRTDAQNSPIELIFSPLEKLATSQDLSSQTSSRVVWHSNIFDFGECASLARNIVTQLAIYQIPFNISPSNYNETYIDSLNGSDPDKYKWLSERCQRTGAVNRTNAINHSQKGIGIIFDTPTKPNNGECFTQFQAKHPHLNYFIGFTKFEADRIPDTWVKECNAMDEVWTTSTFCRTVFINSGVKADKIHVVPVGVDTSHFNPKGQKLLPESKNFRFLSIFTWNNRKGWDILLRSFIQEFSRNETVELIIRSEPDIFKAPELNKRINHFLAEYNQTWDKAPQITLLENYIPDTDIPSLYRSCNAYVLPSRGEGIGLTYLEAMACGLPIIATRWGAPLDFLSDKNALLIEVERLVNIDVHHTLEHFHFSRDMMWAEPSYLDLAKKMRSLFTDKKLTIELGDWARRTVEHHHQIAFTGAWIEKKLRSLI